MYLSRVRSLLLIMFAAAGAAAGCGEGTLSSPTGPSALSDTAAIGADASDALASTTDAALASTGDDTLVALDRGRGSNSGHGNGKDKDKAKEEKDKSDRGPGRRDDDEAEEEEEEEEDDDDGEDGDRSGRRRNLSGWVTAVGTDSITIGSIVVKVTDTTLIRHGHRHLTLAQIKPGDHAQAKGMMSADGMTFMAREIKVEDTGRDNDDEDDEDDADQVELKGTVGGLPAPPLPCPALGFSVTTAAGTTAVKTDMQTVFDDVECAALANGNIVKVRGVRQPDNSILAKKVELEAGPHEVEGVISGLPATPPPLPCPTVTFTIGTTTVTTGTGTTFNGVACAALTNGMRVEVEGTLTGTTMAAASVERK